MLKKFSKNDFLPGLTTKYEIVIQLTEDSIPYRYMNTTYSSEEHANGEIERLIKHREKKQQEPFYKIVVKPLRVRTLKKPYNPF